MLRGINKVIIIGNLGRDPELKYTAAGVPVALISVATTEHWKDKTTNQHKSHTEWHRIIFYKNEAQQISQFLRKGNKIYIEGSSHCRKKKDKNGKDIYRHEIRGTDFQLLSSEEDNQYSQS